MFNNFSFAWDIYLRINFLESLTQDPKHFLPKGTSEGQVVILTNIVALTCPSSKMQK